MKFNPQSIQRPRRQSYNINQNSIYSKPKHLFSHKYLCLGLIHLNIITHSPSTHCNGWSSVSAILFFNWTSAVLPTRTGWFYLLANSRISITSRCDIWSAADSRLRNFLTTGYSTTMINLLLLRRTILEKVRFWSYCETCTSGWVPGRNKERKRN